MELRQLKYFVTVYEEGQFVKAAEKLHITQSALSQQIQVLEQELGAPLFDKHKRKVQRIVSSTPVGKEFYKDAKKIIELSDRLVNKVKDLVSKDLVIRFGTYQLLNKKQIINTIEKIRSRYPLALFKISEFSTPSDVQMALKDDLIDCGVTILPIAHEGLHFEYLGEVKMSLILPNDHRLSNQEEISLDMLKHENWIEIDHKVHPIFRDIESVSRQLGLNERKIIQEVPTLDLLCHFVNIGKGIAFAPSYIDISDYSNLKMVKIASPFIKLEQVLSYQVQNGKLYQF